MASNSTWFTTTLDPTVNLDEQGRPVTSTVISLSPPNTETASSTWYVDSAKTVEVFTTYYRENSTGTPITNTIPKQTKLQQDATPLSKAMDSITSSLLSTRTPRATPAPRSVHSSSGISDGALAGAIVGSIIGTALVTLLLAFLFFRRRNSKPAKQIDDDTFAGAATRHRESKSKSKSGSFPLADIIPQPEPADDDTVRRRILTLVDQAGLHIDNYYVPGSTPAHLSSEQSARLEVYNSADLPAPIETLLGQREIRRQAIKYSLVRTILQGIMPRGNGSGELLPRAFADMPVVEGSSGTLSPFYSDSTPHLFLQIMLTIPSSQAPPQSLTGACSQHTSTPKHSPRQPRTAATETAKSNPPHP